MNIIDISNFNIIFTSEFSLEERRRGRPFGGKMWLTRKNVNVVACTELSQSIMGISIELENNKLLHVYGVWLKFDDNSKESLDEFKSSIIILESEIKNCIDRDLPFIVMGDWNADLNRDRRFDEIFRQFIVKNNLYVSDDFDINNVGYTYKNSDYKASLDHIVWGKN